MDEFDPKKLEIDPPPAIRPQARDAIVTNIVTDFPPFTKTPKVWLKQLAKARHASTLKLAHFLRFRIYKGETEITVSLKTTKLWGLSKDSRQTALAELTKLGLIRVISTGRRRAPKVVVIGG